MYHLSRSVQVEQYGVVNVDTWRKAVDAILNDVALTKELHEKLPSEREYRERYGFSIESIRKAFRHLESLGVLQRHPRARATVLSRDVRTYSDVGFAASLWREQNLKTKTHVLDRQMRHVNSGTHSAVEQRAANSLRIGKGQFFFLSRRRIVNDRPRALHRSYLNPMHFPQVDLFADHDFEKESLMTFFQEYFTLLERSTEVRSRHATDREIADLQVELAPVRCKTASGKNVDALVPPCVLEVEQQLLGCPKKGGDTITLEYLHATYLDWTFQVTRGVTS